MAITQAGIRISDPVVAGLVVGALNGARISVARQMLRVIEVGGKGAKGKIVVENSAAFMGDPSASLKRAPGSDMRPINAEPPGSVEYRTVPHSCTYGPIPKEHERRSQIGSLQRRGARACASALRIDEDVDLAAAMLTTAGGWANTTAAALAGGGGLQFNAVGATPLTALDAVKILARNAAHGRDPDSLILPVDVADAMRRNAEVRGYLTVSTANGTAIGAGGERVVSEDSLATILKAQLGFKQVGIAKARRRTSQPGQTYAEADIFSDALWMGSLLGEDGETASAEAMEGGDVAVEAVAAAMVVEQEVEADIEWDWKPQSWWAWADEAYVLKVLDPTLGYLLRDVLA